MITAIGHKSSGASCRQPPTVRARGAPFSAPPAEARRHAGDGKMGRTCRYARSVEMAKKCEEEACARALRRPGSRRETGWRRRRGADASAGKGRTPACAAGIMGIEPARSWCAMRRWMFSSNRRVEAAPPRLRAAAHSAWRRRRQPWRQRQSRCRPTFSSRARIAVPTALHGRRLAPAHRCEPGRYQVPAARVPGANMSGGSHRSRRPSMKMARRLRARNPRRPRRQRRRCHGEERGRMR